MRTSSRLLLICLFAGATAVQLAGCAATSEHRSTGQFVDDGALTARVKTAIASEANPSMAMNVNVTTYRGTVQLSGFVDSEQTAQRAEQIARHVEGVRSVKNDLTVASARR
jgi:hyperosmotically inducible protein